MRVSLKKLFAVFFLSASVSASAQTLVETWTYAGGALNPSTYGGNYRPSELFADGLTGGTITPSGMGDFGGLGSGTWPSGYGGYYTFLSEPSFTLEIPTVLPGVNTITISITVGGGNPQFVEYDASSLVLNYNAENTALASSSFLSQSSGLVDTPLGPMEMTIFSWTWTGLADLGLSTEFSTSWDTQGQEHVFFNAFSVTQAVPEPSIVGLLAVSGALFVLRRKRL